MLRKVVARSTLARMGIEWRSRLVDDIGQFKPIRSCRKPYLPNKAVAARGGRLDPKRCYERSCLVHSDFDGATCLNLGNIRSIKKEILIDGLPTTVVDKIGRLPGKTELHDVPRLCVDACAHDAVVQHTTSNEYRLRRMVRLCR